MIELVNSTDVKIEVLDEKALETAFNTSKRTVKDATEVKGLCATENT